MGVLGDATRSDTSAGPECRPPGGHHHHGPTTRTFSRRSQLVSSIRQRRSWPQCGRPRTRGWSERRRHGRHFLRRRRPSARARDGEPGPGTVLEDLITTGEGLEVAERDVQPREVGQVPRKLDDLVIAVVRDGQVLAYHSPGVGHLVRGDGSSSSVRGGAAVGTPTRTSEATARMSRRMGADARRCDHRAWWPGGARRTTFRPGPGPGKSSWTCRRVTGPISCSARPLSAAAGRAAMAGLECSGTVSLLGDGVIGWDSVIGVCSVVGWRIRREGCGSRRATAADSAWRRPRHGRCAARGDVHSLVQRVHDRRPTARRGPAGARRSGWRRNHGNPARPGGRGDRGDDRGFGREVGPVRGAGRDDPGELPRRGLRDHRAGRDWRARGRRHSRCDWREYLERNLSALAPAGRLVVIGLQAGGGPRWTSRCSWPSEPR